MGDPWIEPTYDEQLQSYSDMQGGLYGKNPAQRLNYGQDIMSSLKAMGVDLTTLFAPGAASAAPQYVEPMNQTGAIYGQDQFFASIFQSIEEGNDPISAAKQARDQLGYKGTNDEFLQTVVPIATQYAGERVKNEQARSQWEAENGGGWTLPDGTRAKTNPMGGNSADATASEYDLLGAPDPEALFNAYVQQNGTRPKMTPGAGISASAGPENSSGFGWTAGARPQVTSPLPPAPRAPGKNLPPGVVDYTPTPSGDVGIPIAARSAANPQPRNAAPRLAGGNFFLEKAAKDSINKRVDQAKNTRIRSDAGTKAENTIMALAALMQGGFPG